MGRLRLNMTSSSIVYKQIEDGVMKSQSHCMSERGASDIDFENKTDSGMDYPLLELALKTNPFVQVKKKQSNMQKKLVILIFKKSECFYRRKYMYFCSNFVSDFEIDFF